MSPPPKKQRTDALSTSQPLPTTGIQDEFGQQTDFVPLPDVDDHGTDASRPLPDVDDHRTEQRIGSSPQEASPNVSSTSQPFSKTETLERDAHDTLMRQPNGTYASVENDAATKRKREVAMQAKMAFNQARFQLEDKAKTDNIFAKPLLIVVEHFEKVDQAKPEVIADRDLSNPAGFDLGFPGDRRLHSISVMNWLSLEARDAFDPSYDLAWFSENLITNMVLLDSDKAARGVHYCDPIELLQWTSRDYTQAQQVQRLGTALEGVKSTGNMPVIDGNHYRFPAFDMPVDADCLVLPLNTGSHWCTVKFEPDYETRQGLIVFYDSLEAQSVKNRVYAVMPLLAELINARPGLTWNQKSWRVQQGQTTLQANANDCGPITGDNCRRLLHGLQPRVVEGIKQRATHGLDLRYILLQRLYSLLIGSGFPHSNLRKSKAPPPTAATGLYAGPALRTRRQNQAGITHASASTFHAQIAGAANLVDDGMEVDTSLFVDDNSSEEASEADVSSEKASEAYASSEEALEADASSEDDLEDKVESIDRAAGLREVLCNILGDRSAMTFDELLARVMQAYPDCDNYDKLAEHVNTLLEETDFMFDWDWSDHDKSWFILPGKGRSVDTTTIERLKSWVPPVAAADTGNMLRKAFSVAISVVRSSWVVRSDSAIAHRMRAEDLFRAYWAAFGQGERPARARNDDVEIPEHPFWTTCFLEGSSSRSKFFGGTCPDERRIVDLLDRLNLKAKKENQPCTVLLLGNGLDGLYTVNTEWQELREQWRYLDFFVTLALPQDALNLSGLFEQANERTQWAHYRVATLVSTLRSPRELGDQNTDPGNDLEIDSDLLSAQLTSEAGQSNAKEAVVQRSLQLHHEQFLWLSQLINCFKLDYSLCKTHPSAGVTPTRDNALACSWTHRTKRNRFGLGLEEESDEDSGEESEEEGYLYQEGDWGPRGPLWKVGHEVELPLTYLVATNKFGGTKEHKIRFHVVCVLSIPHLSRPSWAGHCARLLPKLGKEKRA